MRKISGMATVAEIQERLALYKAAEQAILEGGQSYRLGDLTLTRADLAMVREEIRALELRLAAARNNGRLSHSTVVFGGRR